MWAWFRYAIVWIPVGAIDGAAVANATRVDGAYLGGIAAIIASIGGILATLLAYRRGQQSIAASSNEDAAVAWKAVADARTRELEQLQRRLERREQRGR